MIRSPGPVQGLAAVALLSLGLSACNQTAATPPAPPPGTVAGMTPNPIRMPDGGVGCSGEIAQFRAVLKNDVDTGNVGQSVYNRASADLGRADSACAAGRDGEARSLVASTKSRFGYR